MGMKVALVLLCLVLTNLDGLVRTIDWTFIVIIQSNQNGDVSGNVDK